MPQDIVEGHPSDASVSELGRCDGMLDFMLRSGRWTADTQMRPPDLKKDNGMAVRIGC